LFVIFEKKPKKERRKGSTSVFMRRSRGKKTQRGISRTYEDGADERVVQNPSDGYVGDAHTAVAVADSS
jgi:hypothetical protein